MTKYDVTDEALISADPHAVYCAVVDEMDGKTQWWTEHHSFHLRSGNSSAAVGAVVDSAVHGKWDTRFSTETTEAVPDELIRLRYVEGAFRGEGVWRFENEGGNTRVSYRWQTRPAGPLRAFAAVLPVKKSHCDVMRAGFANLEAFLA